MRSLFLCLPLCGLLLGLPALALPKPTPAPARPVQKLKPVKTPVIPAPDWLAPAAPLRSQTLADLAPLAQQPPYDAIRRLLAQAQKKLLKPTLADKRDGIDNAYDAALLAQNRAKDPALTARIFDGFLLPFVPAAHPEAAYQTSRQSLLKAAFTVYQQNEQPDREKDALSLLRYWAADDNTHDWACVQLVPLYVAGQDYGQAIAALKAIRTPGMKGGDKFLPALEQKLKDQQAKNQQAKNQQAKEAQAKPVTAPPKH